MNFQISLFIAWNSMKDYNKHYNSLCFPRIFTELNVCLFFVLLYLWMLCRVLYLNFWWLFNRCCAGLTPKDPRWIGAWWIGFLLFGILFFLVAAITATFPRYHKENTANSLCKINISEFYSYICDLTYKHCLDIDTFICLYYFREKFDW